MLDISKKFYYLSLSDHTFYNQITKKRWDSLFDLKNTLGAYYSTWKSKNKFLVINCPFNGKINNRYTKLR